MGSQSQSQMTYRNINVVISSLMLSVVHSADCGSNVISNVRIYSAEAALSFVVGDVRLQNVEIHNSLTAVSLLDMTSLQLTNCRPVARPDSCRLSSAR